MKAAPFAYAAPSTVDEAVALAASDPDAKFIAGGQSLMPLLALRLGQPSLLIDLGGIPELQGLRIDSGTVDSSTVDGGTVWVGAGTRHHQLAAQTEVPLLAEAARWIGHTAIRSRGTIGGSVAHADPAAEWPSVLLALDAIADVATADGTRRSFNLADDFFQGHIQTRLDDGDLLTGFRFRQPLRWGFAELARRAGDFALVLVVAAELADGWRLVVGGVESTPIRLAAAEALLDASAGSGDMADLAAVPALAAAAAAAAAAAVDPLPSLHASPRYLRAMTAEFTTRAVAAALSGTR